MVRTSIEAVALFTAKAVAVVAASFFVLSCQEKNADKIQQQETQQTELPIIKQAPTYTAQGVGIQNFTSAEYKGKVAVVMFGFTECKGPCPRMTEQMATLQQDFTSEKDVRFVFISVDANADSLDALRKYAISYSADTTSWHFVTMPRDSVIRVSTQGFLLGNPEEPLDHSTRFTLIDRKGDIRGYYDALDTLAMQNIRKDIRKLLEL